MATSFENLRVMQLAETVAGNSWEIVKSWDSFAKDTIGKQMVRAIDSIGANIAESFGRFHYGEKIQFLYYARGSLFEAKYWINLAFKRNLITNEQQAKFAKELEQTAKQINSFANSLKAQRKNKPKGTVLKEESAVYETNPSIFTPEDLDYLIQSPISNY